MPDPVVIQSARLQLREFQMTDSEDVYACITPTLPRFMFWEPPQSLEAYKERRAAVLRSDDKSGFSFVIRRLDTLECMGIASLDDVHAAAPELGIWIKEAGHGNGYGSEAVRAVIDWARRDLGKTRFVYVTAVENAPSIRIAEALGGEVIGTRTSPKYDSVVYQIDCERTR